MFCTAAGSALHYIEIWKVSISLAVRGIFLHALLKLLAVYDDDLCSHLEAPTMRCATQVSAQTQNELIKVMGKHMSTRV